MPEPAPRKRLAVYIDGMNFFLARRAAGAGFNVDIAALGEKLAERVGAELAVVHYYSSPHPHRGSVAYQARERFFEALRRNPKVDLVLGRHAERIDSDGTVTHDEKESDVNLAADLVADAYEDAYDIAMVVSGDSDFVRAFERTRRAGKDVAWCHLPAQQSDRLRSAAGMEMELTPAFLEKCQHRTERARDREHRGSMESRDRALRIVDEAERRQPRPTRPMPRVLSR